MDAAGAATNASIMNNLICPLVAFIHTLLGNQLICISCIEVPEIRNKIPNYTIETDCLSL